MSLLSESITHQSYVQDMSNEGVVVFKKKIALPKIEKLIEETNKIRQMVLGKIQHMERPLKTHSDIAERELGRLDYRCGFVGEIFDEIAQPIIKIVNDMSPTVDFNHYWGLITSLGHSGPTDMHRDVFSVVNTPIDNNLDAHDMHLPPYYFTVLMPLVEISRENGPTEFIKGSNSKTIVDADKAERFAPLTSPGDVVIFDGRTLHRGCANTTDHERVVAYITFIAKWYHDQTFVVNNYLFPELAIKGR